MWLAATKPFKNINRIFPTQQEDIRQMIEACKKDENIQRIIIFGSSVTSSCNPWSDIDIYFECQTPPKRYPGIKSSTAVFDKWDNFNADATLKQEIKEKGVVVYERQPQHADAA